MDRITPNTQNLLTNLGSPVAWFASNPSLVVFNGLVVPPVSQGLVYGILYGFMDSVSIWQIPTEDTKATRDGEEAGVLVLVRNDRFVTMLTKR
jgi:hypothetical protein